MGDIGDRGTIGIIGNIEHLVFPSTQLSHNYPKKQMLEGCNLHYSAIASTADTNGSIVIIHTGAWCNWRNRRLALAPGATTRRTPPGKHKPRTAREVQREDIRRGKKTAGKVCDRGICGYDRLVEFTECCQDEGRYKP